MKKLVLASSNPGKLREFEALLGAMGIEVIAQSRLGIPQAHEPHRTFVENAIAKARHASRLSKLPAFADDSGICARALGGEPGVHSARFAGEPQSDQRNNAKLIELLRDQEDRRAHYFCVIALLRHAEDPEPLIAEGSWQGRLIEEPRGANGFGYDPYFYLPDLGRTAAELDPGEKNRISHRGKALRRLLAKLREGG